MSERLGTPEERARHRVEERNGLIWHAIVYVLVNSFLWLQDLLSGGGLDWAYWATIPWGIGLVLHAVAYQMESRGNDRVYQRFLAEEREREQQLPQEHQLF